MLKILYFVYKAFSTSVKFLKIFTISFRFWIQICIIGLPHISKKIECIYPKYFVKFELPILARIIILS